MKTLKLNEYRFITNIRGVVNFYPSASSTTSAVLGRELKTGYSAIVKIYSHSTSYMSIGYHYPLQIYYNSDNHYRTINVISGVR